MSKKTFNIILVVAIIAAIIASGVAIFNIKNQHSEPTLVESASNSTSTTDSSDAVEIATADAIYDAIPASGNLGEKIIGDPNTAKVVVYDYADYACSHCSTWNFILNKLIEQYPDQIALVFRGADVGFTNGRAAAKAATAAQAQGYWKEFKDLLFADQADWAYLDAADLPDKFAEYFETASGGNGDVAKFKADLTSSDIIKRVDFEKELAAKAGVSATPTIRIDGEAVPLSDVESTIKAKLGV